MRTGIVALPRALDEHDALDVLAIGALDRTAVGSSRQRFQSCLVDDVRLAAAQLGQLGHVVSRKAGRLDDRADGFLDDDAGFLRDLDREAAGHAGGLSDRRVEMNADRRMRSHLGDEIGEARVLRLGIRRAVRDALPELRRPAAERSRLFDEDDFIAGFRSFERCGEPGHAATDDENPLVGRCVGIARGHFHLLYFGAAHPHVVVGHFLPHLVVRAAFGDDPDDALAQVRARHGDRRKMKRFGLCPSRARTDHHVRDAFLLDVVADRLHARG